MTGTGNGVRAPRPWLGVGWGRAENGLCPRFWGAAPSPRDTVPCRARPRGRKGRRVTDGVQPRGAAVAGEAGRAAMLDRASSFTADGACPVTRWHVAFGDGQQEEVYWVVGACGVRAGAAAWVVCHSAGGCVALCGAPSGPGPGGGKGKASWGALSGSAAPPHCGLRDLAEVLGVACSCGSPVVAGPRR